MHFGRNRQKISRLLANTRPIWPNAWFPDNITYVMQATCTTMIQLGATYPKMCVTFTIILTCTDCIENRIKFCSCVLNLTFASVPLLHLACVFLHKVVLTFIFQLHTVLHTFYVLLNNLLFCTICIQFVHKANTKSLH